MANFTVVLLREIATATLTPAATVLISQEPSMSRQGPPPAKDYDALKAQMMVSTSKLS